MIDLKKILLLGSILAVNIGQNAHPILGKWVYYKGVALGWLLILALVKLLCEKHENLKLYANIAFYLCLNAFLDELFFDPVKFQANDYIAAIVIIIWQYKLNKKQKNASKPRRI